MRLPHVNSGWLNVAEIELNVMIAQCLNRRIDKIEIVRSELAAWQVSRDQINAKIDWQFTTDSARIKLKRALSDISGVTRH